MPNGYSCLACGKRWITGGHSCVDHLRGVVKGKDDRSKEFPSEYEMLKEIRNLRENLHKKQIVLQTSYNYVLKQDETEEAISLRADLVDNGCI